MSDNATPEKCTQTIFTHIDEDDLDGISRLLDTDPMRVHARHADPERHHWSTLQFAAARGRLAVCRLLVERGAEVYTNPMNTYPPVMQAAWNKHQAVVDYFLDEIPNQADGTNGLGVTMNLAAREGWTDIVRRHVEADPLSVHQRGWIGDTPLHWPAHNNLVEIRALLLDAGANIEADEINCYGGKPLLGLYEPSNPYGDEFVGEFTANRFFRERISATMFVIDESIWHSPLDPTYTGGFIQHSTVLMNERQLEAITYGAELKELVPSWCVEQTWKPAN